jgi:hypothetical protein
MIERHGGGPGRPGARKKRLVSKAVTAVLVRQAQRSSMGSDGDASDSHSDRGYSDESEPELEAGCMGVKDPKEKKAKSQGKERLQAVALGALFLSIGAFLPFLLMTTLEFMAHSADPAGAGGGGGSRRSDAMNSVVAAVSGINGSGAGVSGGGAAVTGGSVMGLPALKHKVIPIHTCIYLDPSVYIY